MAPFQSTRTTGRRHSKPKREIVPPDVVVRFDPSIIRDPVKRATLQAQLDSLRRPAA